MSLSEKRIMHILQQYSNKQLLDIKSNGYDSPEFKALEAETDAKYYRTFALGRVAEELFARNLWQPGFDFDIWWERYTGY